MLACLLVSLALAQSAPAAPSTPSAPAVVPAAAAAPAPLSVPRFARTTVGTCGCSLYAPPGMAFDPPTLSEDGAQVWTGEVRHGGAEAGAGWTFGAIVVKFKEPFADASPEQLEELLVAYMDFLRTQFEITANAGVGRGHTHSENTGARGVIDYWKDKVGDDWAVKGWIDKDRLAILFVAGKGDFPYFSAQQMYLEGFRFN